jgi:two-component system, NarL family, nitrate/nitrite response regulator NarL
MTAQPPIRVLVTDASVMGCELLADRLRRARFEVVACSVAVDDLVTKVAETSPDVVIISVNLQDSRLGGYSTLREIKKRDLKVNSIMLLEERDRELIISAFRGGAKGVFFRAEPFSALCKCIRAVRNGQIWASTKDMELILEALANAAPLREVDANTARSVTRREEQIINLVARGHSNREIAQKLYLSEHTVKNYMFRIFEKLNVSSRVELVLFATNSGTNEAA